MYIESFTNAARIGMPAVLLKHNTAYDYFIFNALMEFDAKGLILSGDTAVDQTDLNTPAPDVVAFTQEIVAVFVIEITRSSDVRLMKRKCIRYYNEYPDIQEIFVFDYQKQILYAMGETPDEWFSSINNIIYSDFLEFPVIDYFCHPRSFMQIHNNSN